VQVSRTVERVESGPNDRRRVPDVVGPCRRDEQVTVGRLNGAGEVGRASSDGLDMRPPLREVRRGEVLARTIEAALTCRVPS
jgi:hypothetical protein